MSRDRSANIYSNRGVAPLWPAQLEVAARALNRARLYPGSEVNVGKVSGSDARLQGRVGIEIRSRRLATVFEGDD